MSESQVKQVATNPESFRSSSSSSSSTSSSSSSSSRASSRYNPSSSSRRQIRILSHDFSDTNDGNWNYAFESENGIKQEARGEMRSIGDALVRFTVNNEITNKK